jgi:hypothetical protein
METKTENETYDQLLKKPSFVARFWAGKYLNKGGGYLSTQAKSLLNFHATSLSPGVSILLLENKLKSDLPIISGIEVVNSEGYLQKEIFTKSHFLNSEEKISEEESFQRSINL